MNLVGHVAVAVRAGAPHETVPTLTLVGAMLPDLAGMARVRLGAVQSDDDRGHDLAVGVALHHASDAAFHGSRWFNDHNQSLRDDLLGAGVDRGAARASAHAGLEMLLDGELMGDPAVAAAATRAFAALAEDGAMRETLGALAPPDARVQWVERLGMIGRNLDPYAYRSPDAVAVRLRRITSDRPRIALRAEQVDLVAGVLHRRRAAITRDSAQVVERVADEVQTSLAPG